jgi:hypothetical protein
VEIRLFAALGSRSAVSRPPGRGTNGPRHDPLDRKREKTTREQDDEQKPTQRRREAGLSKGPGRRGRQRPRRRREREGQRKPRARPTHRREESHQSRPFPNRAGRTHRREEVRQSRPFPNLEPQEDNYGESAYGRFGRLDNRHTVAYLSSSYGAPFIRDSWYPRVGHVSRRYANG